MILSHLPAVLLGSILGESGSSYLILDLWKCGDKLLNAKLASSVTHIELERHPAYFGNYPRILSEFRSLRYLSLKSTHDLMKNVMDWQLEVSKLSDRIETLRIESPDASCVFLNFAPDWTQDSSSLIETSYKRGKSSLIDFESKFPRLHTLHLEDGGDYFIHGLAALPPSLTILSTLKITISVGEPTIIDQLPPSLLKLDADIEIESGALQGVYLDAWSRAPPHLESIRSINWYDDIETFEWMPRSLTECHIPRGVIIAPTPTLPPLLNSINLISFNASSSELSNTPWPSMLPSNLTRLTLAPQNDEIQLTLDANLHLLPKTLTALIIPHLVFGTSLISWSEIRRESIAPGAENIWPPRLEELRLGGHTVRFKDVSLLPSTLKSLDIALGEYHGATTHYTRSQFESDFLPSNLIYLKLTMRWNRAVLDSPNAPIILPSTITNLEIEEWHINWFMTIPRATSSLLIRRLHGAHRSSLTEENDIFKDLPSGLKSLAIERLDGPMAELLFGEAAFYAQSFSSLPNLEELRVVSIGSFPAKVLRNLPRGMMALQIELQDLNEEDAPFIPPRLTTFMLLGSNIPWRLPHVSEYWPLRAAQRGNTSNAVFANLAEKFPALQGA